MHHEQHLLGRTDAFIAETGVQDNRSCYDLARGRTTTADDALEGMRFRGHTVVVIGGSQGWAARPGVRAFAVHPNGIRTEPGRQRSSVDHMGIEQLATKYRTFWKTVEQALRRRSGLPCLPSSTAAGACPSGAWVPSADGGSP